MVFTSITYLYSTIEQLENSVEVSKISQNDFTTCNNVSDSKYYTEGNSYIYIHNSNATGQKFSDQQINEYLKYIVLLDEMYIILFLFNLLE